MVSIMSLGHMSMGLFMLLMVVTLLFTMAHKGRWSQKMLFSQGVAGGAEYKPANTNLLG